MRDRSETITRRDIERLLGAMSDQAPSGIRNRALLALLWGCGLRFEEAIALRAGDLDLKHHSVRVGKVRIGRVRELPLAPETRGLITDWLVTRRRWITRLRIEGDPPLFCTIERKRFGQPLSQIYIGGMLRRVAKKAEIEKPVRKDSLREALWLELLDLGFSPTPVAQFLGDASYADRSYDPPQFPPLVPPRFASGIIDLGDPWGFSDTEVRFSVPREGTSEEKPAGGDSAQVILWDRYVMTDRGHYQHEGTRRESFPPIQQPLGTSESAEEATAERLRRLEVEVSDLRKSVDELIKVLGAREGNRAD